jgi:hypothetical protein
MPESIKAISAISHVACARDSVTAHMIRLLNDGGLRHPVQPKNKFKITKGKAARHDDLEHSDHEFHYIDILA